MADVVRYELRKCKDRGELGALYARFAGYLDRTPFIDPPTYNTLVVCAEVAIEVGHLAAAQDALHRYFVGSDGVMRDQFLCRALFARALLHHQQIKHLKGQDLVSSTVEGISHLLEALKVAEGNDRYAFLVYNGSVHFWHVSRPLQRTGLRKHLLESQQAIVEALDQVPGQETWKVRNKINLALCYAEANQLENATKALDSVAPLEEKIDMSLKRLLYRCRVHIGCVSGKVKGAVKFDQSELTAMGNIQMVKSSDLPMEETEKLLAAAWEEVDPTPDGPTKDVPLNVVAAIGWVAAVKGMTALAKKCGTRASASQDVAPRAWATLIDAQLAILDLGDHKENLTKRAVDGRIVNLATCERSMSDFLRIEDVDGVQESCRSMWNAGLPLLQDNLRHHIKKPFASACRALATIDSPLHKLRIQFHLEVAKCDASDELVLKARDEVRKACALDYVTNSEDTEKHGLERPLDRHLEPFERGLTLRTSGADECQCVEDEVLLLVERAKESSSRHVKEDCLKRAIDALEPLPLTERNENDVDSLLADKFLCRKRFLLWGSLIKCAWSVQLQEIVRAAAPYALRPPWNPEVDNEMALLQVEVGFLEAEACVLALQSSGAEVTPPHSEVEVTYNEKGMRLPAATAEELRANVLMSIVQAMKTAAAAKEVEMVSNGGVCVWNYYKPLIKQWRFAELGNAMSDVLEILMTAEVGEIDPMLLCDLAETHLKALEHQYLLGVVGKSEEGGSKKGSVPDLQSVRAAAGKLGILEEGDAALIDSAVQLCKSFSAKYCESLSQELIETISRIESLKADKTAKEGIASGTSKTGQFVAILSNLGSQSTEKNASQDLDQIKKAIQILRDQDITDCEMWSKLSRACIRVQHFGEGLDCAEVAMKTLPEDIQPESVLHKSDCGRISDKEWHWLAVAELVMGQAMVGLLEAGSQEKLVEIDVKKRALGHFVVATRFSSFIHATDLMDNLAVCAWNIAKDFVGVPGLICTLSEPLTDLTELLNAFPIPNGRVQVGLSCLVLQLHLSQGSYQEGLHHAHAAIQATPKSAQRPLIPYKIQLLKKLGTGVKEEMAQAMEYQLENQSFAWSTFADLFANPADQLEARKKSQELSMPTPYVHAHCRLDYAEWLHTVARESDEAVSVALSTGGKCGDDLNNLSLVQKCDILCRCHLLLHRIAKDEKTGFEHLMAAYEACLEILTSTLVNGCAGGNGDGTGEESLECVDIKVPDCLTEWITFTLPTAAADKISSTTNHNSVLNQASKILAERFGCLLDVLTKGLQAGGCQLQCVPVLHLYLIFAKCVMKCEMLFRMVSLRLSSTLKGLGLSHRAEFFESQAGKYWEIDEATLDALHDYMESRKAAESCSMQRGLKERTDPSQVLHRMQSYEFLLFAGRHLSATDRPALAKPVFLVVLEAARAHGDRACEANCLVHLADCELMLDSPERSLVNVTAAVEYGGDVEFWELAMYVFVKAAQESNAAMECIEKTIMTALHFVQDARSKDECCGGLNRLEAFLHKSLGNIKIMQFMHEGMSDMHQHAMEHYRTSFDLLKKSGQMEIVDAAEVLCNAIAISPITAIDRRPLLREQKAMWEGAEEVLSTISARVDPGGAFDGLTLPSSRKLVQVRTKLAAVHLELARECQNHRDRDAASRRPDFQKVPGKDTAVIERYLDSMLGVAVDSVAVHMETSLLFSGNAANGTRLPCLRAPALAMTGDALVFEAYRCCPDSDNPWSVLEGEEEKLEQPPATEIGEESSEDTVENNEEKTATEIEVVDPVKKAAIEKTKKCISQASHLFKTSLELSAEYDMRQSQQSAFSSSLCFGRWNPHQTAEHLCLSQSYRIASMLKLRRSKGITTSRPDPSRNGDLGGRTCNDLLKSHSLKIMEVIREDSFAAGIQKLSDGVNLLVIHMDPRKEHVYVALVERDRFNSGEESEGSKPEGIRVERFSVGRGAESLQGVLNAIEKFDNEFKSRSGDGKRDGLAEEHTGLGESWKLCVEAAEGFFSPVMNLFEAAATPPEGGGSPPSVILLVDPEMDTFPFESFAAFKYCASVSLDFSLALLMSRMETEVDASMSDFKYISQPKWCQTNGDENAKLVAEFKTTIVDQYGKLEGLTGSHDCSTSVEETQEMLAEAKSFLYHADPSFLSFMSPLAISSLDLSQCKMAVLLHRDAHCPPHELMDRAFLRSQLSTWSHNIPFCTAMLLSACGARSIALNRIPVQNVEGIDQLQNILQGLSTGVSIGQATRSCFKEDQPAFKQSQLRVYGIPTLTAVASGKGGKAKKKK